METKEYRLKTPIVKAWKLTQGLKTSDGKDGRPGDWIITFPDGAMSFMTDAEFRRVYEEAQPKVIYREKTQQQLRSEWGIYG